MRRSSLFLLACSVIGAVALIAMWPPRAPKPAPTPEAPLPLVTRPSSLATPVVLPTDPILGDPNAPLTIVEFGDYTCPTCAGVRDVLTELQREYATRLRIVWKDFPILDRLTGSRQLHIAARCAATQGGFWEYHEVLFDEQPREVSDLLAVAQRLGLERSSFAECLSTGASTALVDASTAEARRIGLTAVPAFFVNGTWLTEPPTFGALSALLDAAPTRP